MNKKRTLVVGATTNPDRYAYLAANRLIDHGHQIELLGIKKGEVRSIPIKTKEEIRGEFDTVTLYVGPKNQASYIDYIIDLKPKRVIFNPGTWNSEFADKLKENQIQTEEACTLVMLSAGTY